MKDNPQPLPLHASCNRGDALPASPHPPEPFTKEQIEEITSIMKKNAAEMVDIRQKMQDIHDLFFSAMVTACSAEYQQAIREARRGNVKPLKEFLIKSKGMIPGRDQKGAQ